MFNHQLLAVIFCALILLASMIAAIFLTNKRKSNVLIDVKEQNVYKQNSSITSVRLFH